MNNKPVSCMQNITKLCTLLFLIIYLSACSNNIDLVTPTTRPNPSPTPTSTFTPAPTPTKTATATPIFDISKLALPINLDEIAAILESDPRYKFNYKATTKLDNSCSTGTHLGDIIEIYADYDPSFEEIPAPQYSVYAPYDFTLLEGFQGDGYRRLCFSTLLGFNQKNEPVFFSFIHVTELESNFKLQVSNAFGINPLELDVDYDNPDKQVGPFWNLQKEVLIHRDSVVGIKKFPWEWYSDWGPHHSLMLHVLLTKNEPTNNIEPVSAVIPELTNHYLNLVIQGLVLDRELTIGLETEESDFCTNPYQILEKIDPEIREQLIIIQDPDRPRHFDISIQP